MFTRMTINIANVVTHFNILVCFVCMIRIENMLCSAERGERKHDPSKDYGTCE